MQVASVIFTLGGSEKARVSAFSQKIVHTLRKTSCQFHNILPVLSG
jgi:hypothetical protein